MVAEWSLCDRGCTSLNTGGHQRGRERERDLLFLYVWLSVTTGLAAVTFRPVHGWKKHRNGDFPPPPQTHKRHVMSVELGLRTLRNKQGSWKGGSESVEEKRQWEKA